MEAHIRSRRNVASPLDKLGKDIGLGTGKDLGNKGLDRAREDSKSARTRSASDTQATRNDVNSPNRLLPTHQMGEANMAKEVGKRGPEASKSP